MRVLKMDPESDEKARGVLTEILGSSPHAETVRQIEDLLGIDRDFPAAVNLVHIPAHRDRPFRLNVTACSGLT